MTESLETITVTPAGKRYLEALMSNGLFEGQEAQQLTGGAFDVLRALHHVLGGGTIAIEYQGEANQTVAGELETAMNAAMDELPESPPGVQCF